MKKFFNLRNTIVITICLAGLTIFSGCDKESNPNAIAITGINLDVVSHKLFVGTEYTLTATVTPTNATDKNVTWTSNNENVATVVNGIVTAKTVGTATITAKAGNQTATCAITVGLVPADGVLINGVVWATSNVDAPGTFAATPQSTGMLYQWNRMKAYPGTGKISESQWDNTWPVGANTWEKANDPSPAGWRICTYEEQRTLLNTDKVSAVWTTISGIKGTTFTDKTSGNFIFLPAVGYRTSGMVYNDPGSLVDVEVGHYWNGTKAASYEQYLTSFLMFYSASPFFSSVGLRCALSIRSVAEID